MTRGTDSGVRRLALVWLLAWAASACEASAARPPRVLAADSRGPHIAFARDFADFRQWERFELSDLRAQGLTHTAGKRRLYLNARPAAGSAGFPVGTMIVKELLAGAAGHKLFAMVKRGGGYNAAGAPGWEWFELREPEDGPVTIGWRGLDVAAGERYGGGDEGDPLGGCNGCHGLAVNNDFVKAPVLKLAALAR
jgi:hypothetical protein